MCAEMPFQIFVSLAETNCWVSKAVDTAYNETKMYFFCSPYLFSVAFLQFAPNFQQLLVIRVNL